MVMTMLSWGSIAVGLTIENLFLIVIKDLHSKLPLCRSVTKEGYGEINEREQNTYCSDQAPMQVDPSGAGM